MHGGGLIISVPGAAPTLYPHSLPPTRVEPPTHSPVYPPFSQQAAYPDEGGPLYAGGCLGRRTPTCRVMRGGLWSVPTPTCHALRGPKPSNWG